MTVSIECFEPNRIAGILRTARETFESHTETARTYVVYRGLRSNSIPFPQDEPLVTQQGYLTFLPTFKGKDFVTLINEEIVKRKRESAQSGKPYEKVKIADIGYGMGIFLLDCREEWGDDVELIGYGTDVFTREPRFIKGKFGTYKVEPTYDSLKKDGVRLVDGNIIDIRKNLGDNTVDFLVSCYTLLYVNYPSWELTKKLYRTLGLNGIALLHFPKRGVDIVRRVESYLKEKGYDIDEVRFNKLSFMKNLPDINLPIRTVNTDLIGESIVVEDRSDTVPGK